MEHFIAIVTNASPVPDAAAVRTNFLAILTVLNDAKLEALVVVQILLIAFITNAVVWC
jgi:hypothetical protein